MNFNTKKRDILDKYEKVRKNVHTQNTETPIYSLFSEFLLKCHAINWYLYCDLTVNFYEATTYEL